MPQVRKDHVRDRIRTAALEVFSERGAISASMGEIALRAGVATGNLYRYYASKDELLSAAVPPELAAEFSRLLDGSVRALAMLATGAPDTTASDDGAAGEALLRFWLAHRLEVVFLLDRAAGTSYAAYGEDFVARLVALTLDALRAAHPGAAVPPSLRLVLTHVFENTRRVLAALLASTDDEAALRQGVAAFRAYQVAGLRGLAGWFGASAP